jgi:integrase/recombinase XerD
MRTHSPENERLKRLYFTYLKEARRLSEPSIDAAAAALSRFEAYTRYRDFKSFHLQQAVAFKRKLAEQVSARTGERLSKRTLYGTLNALRAFFQWLAGRPGYRSRLTYADADYFALSEKETRIAKAGSERPVPALEQILHVLDRMPDATDIDLRNRALVAFTLLTGARDGAIASMKLKHVDIAEGKVVQDAREVNTKFSKSYMTWFFPVGDGVRQIVVDWIRFLTTEKLFGPTDPLFPAAQVIRANAVAPGPIWTPLIPSTLPEDSVSNFGKQVPMKRPGQPAETATAFVMLADPLSSYISGAIVAVTGGKPTL